MSTPTRETNCLKYTFSTEELREFAQDMAQQVQALAQAEEQKKLANAQFAERIELARTKTLQLSRNINNGYELRMIECRIHLNTPKEGRAEIIRIDTGEFVKERDMTPNEKQLSLPLDEPDKAKGVGA